MPRSHTPLPSLYVNEPINRAPVENDFKFVVEEIDTDKVTEKGSLVLKNLCELERDSQMGDNPLWI